MLLKLIPSDLVLDYNKLQQKDSGSDIQQLLSFLTQSLTVREQTYSTNKSSFELCNRTQETKSNFSREPRSYKQQNQKSFHTASELLTAPVKENKDKIKLICIFCDSMTRVARCPVFFMLVRSRESGIAQPEPPSVRIRFELSTLLFRSSPPSSNGEGGRGRYRGVAVSP
ncbi:transposon Ty3-G Gag-Pol polyprotein [Trichonephila clavipes]|nr:transposon Ty3-G Gag-Pol polyprotein [Trichonephila clavipes]